MEILLIILFLGFLAGMVFREKGDNVFETLSTGCSIVFWIFLVAIVLLVLFIIKG
jgi:hypothetical protein